MVRMGLFFISVFVSHNFIFLLVLTNLGEKLNEDEVNELLKEVEVGKDGRINYVGKFNFLYFYYLFNHFKILLFF